MTNENDLRRILPYVIKRRDKLKETLRILTQHFSTVE